MHLPLLAFLLATLSPATSSKVCAIPVPAGASSPPSVISVDDDYQRNTKSADTARVLVRQDESQLFVTVQAKQNEPVIATQTANGAGVLNDDNVSIYLWPQGARGFAYTFSANPRGARYQSSSENTSYAPQWMAKGSASRDGYTITMKIPFNIMRVGRSGTWRVQIARTVAANHTTTVWCDDSPQNDPFDPTFAGSFTSIGARREATVAVKPQPRLGIYVLGQLQPKSDTSRMGLDLAVPVTPTASFLATLHPDYSNVETDQQTIAPTAFPRQYQEVRPFFTQLTGYYDDTLTCINCPQTLYTPGVPQFAQGYAVEGKRGNLSFSAFDAIGDRRTDAAIASDYEYSDSNSAFGVRVQNVRVDAISDVLPIRDDSTMLSAKYVDQKSHLAVWSNEGFDNGLNVSDPRQATYYEEGVLYGTPLLSAGVALQHVGSQFAPIDGYVQQVDATGPVGLLSRSWSFKPTSPVQDMSVIEIYGNQHNSAGQMRLLRSQSQLTFDFKHEYTFQGYWSVLETQTALASQTGVSDVAPFDQNGAMFGYRVNTSVPTYITYTGGPFYHGQSGAWEYLATLPITPRLHLGLTAQRTWYSPSPFAIKAWGESGGSQWLEKATFDWQFSRVASLDIGVRRILGMVLPNAYQLPAFGKRADCSNAVAGAIIDCTNVSVGFHILVAHEELYAAYGDPNQTQTTPVFLVKFIRYVGAEKGT